MPGALTRLLTENWDEMTAAANASPEHVGSLERWIKRAREQNPSLSDEQARRLAGHLKTAYYAELSRKGVAARQARAAVEATGASGEQ